MGISFSSIIYPDYVYNPNEVCMQKVLCAVARFLKGIDLRDHKATTTLPGNCHNPASSRREEQMQILANSVTSVSATTSAATTTATQNIQTLTTTYSVGNSWKETSASSSNDVINWTNWNVMRETLGASWP
jgi:hypothetical protein